VDFTLARRPGRLQLQFEAMHPGRFTGERLWVTIELGAGDARVRAENHGDLAAQVGTHGNDASILLDATTLPSGLQYLFAGPFRYRARAGTPPVPGQPVIQGDANDTAPQNDGLALYR
jgi:hypothetical protein